MNKKQKPKNCWEFLQCGREYDSRNPDKKDICPVSQDQSSDGINRGKGAGRFCWTIAGTYCNRGIQGSFAKKFFSCLECSFFQKVQEEEDRGFILYIPDKKNRHNEEQ